MIAPGPKVLLQEPGTDAGSWLLLESPIEILDARDLAAVVPALRRIEAATAAGHMAAGFIGYEAAPAFDPALSIREPPPQPLLWFGIFEGRTTVRTGELLARPALTLDWRPTWSETHHAAAVAAIRAQIAAGDTYQVNLTTRLQAAFSGDPLDLFASLYRAQDARHAAFVDTGEWAVCSASPELFLALEQDHIRSRPMKGTTPRGRTLEEDRLLSAELRGSAKNRAENVMIVDMIRNDLGRIAQPDTVRVTELCSLERYPSLFQLTSTVEARSNATITDILAALFPCASVTGAPKVRAMQIIADLETSPRGVYTGAVGSIGPGRRARFNVAIRTVQIDRKLGAASYGTGGGIVWDSDAREEWQECHTKALVLRSPPPRFDLFETLYWSPQEGYRLLDRHLERLVSSAEYFDFPVDEGRIRLHLEKLSLTLPPHPHRIRLVLATTGTSRLDSALLDDTNRPWRVALAAAPVDSSDQFLFHKTSHREVYERHRLAAPGCDDVLLWNEHGELTESTVANIVVERAGRLLTPPVACGLLAGTFRAELLARGEIVEERLPVAELRPDDRISLVNSLRGWIDVELDARRRSDLE